MSQPDPDRREATRAILLSLIAGIIGDNLKDLGKAADRAFNPDYAALETPFECWAPVPKGRVFVTVQPVCEPGKVVFAIQAVHEFLHGPIPCKQALEVIEAEIILALNERALEIDTDWSGCDWGAFGHLRRHFK